MRDQRVKILYETWLKQLNRTIINREKTYRFIISGGGTGGHIYPAIAIANQIKAVQPSADVLFVGAQGKMEMQKVPEAGYPIIGLPVAGLQRRLTLKNLSFPFKLLRSLRKASKIIKDFRPDVAIGVGGYASAPILRTANKRNVPTVVQEQNSYAGLTNKMLGQRADKICVAYAGMDQYFPKERVKNLGNPVRTDIITGEVDRAEAMEHFGLNASKKTIVVLGGSLGARTINDSIIAKIDQLAVESDIQVLWQTGKLYFEEMTNKHHASKAENVKPVEFIKEMNLAYTAADIVISRAGALSISELALVGKPVIFVPSPNVAEDHQTKNAMALVNEEAALLVKDIEAREKLVPEALQLMKNEALKSKLSTNIKTFAKPNATKDIVNEILELLN